NLIFIRKSKKNMDYLSQIHDAVSFIQKSHPSPVPIGIILGTGLGSLGDQIEVELEIEYKDIPHFPLSTVESHSGKLIFGTLSGKKVVAMRGRFHYYEGYSMKEVTLPVRVMRRLGVQTLLVSNACGGLDPLQEVGDVMIISDHINMFSENPLRGKNYDELGPRFPDMSDTYSVDLMEKAFVIAESHGIKLHRGV